MTFYEAAVEVLRQADRPLHYKKITEIAVRENLLSHVGKTPHLTMNDRLEKELQKNEATAIAQERPGVFKLDGDRADEVAERVKEKHRRERESRESRESRGNDRGGSSKKNRSAESGSDDSGESRKRRRSRGSSNRAEPKTREKDRSNQPDRSDRKRTRSTGDRHDEGGGDGGADDENRDRPRRSRSSPSTKAATDRADLDVSRIKHLEEGPVRLEGIPEAAHQVLSEADDGAMPIDELADRIFDRNLVKFHTHEPVATVQSALANDNQVRQEYGHRPLFAQENGRWRLTEWDLDGDVLEREQAALSLTEEVRRATADQLARSLRDVRAEALEHVALTLLERIGYRNIKVSKRSSEGDVFFTADWRQGLDDVRVCVRVVTDHDRQLQASAVDDLRETLDHYSASEGLIIHLGDVSDGAVQKARIEGESPITVFGRDNFVELLMKYGIGVKTYRAPIVTIDPSFIDALVD